MNSNPKCPTCGVAIDDHEATPCLDTWIAQLMDWQFDIGGGSVPSEWLAPDGKTRSFLPPKYATEDGAANQVVDHILALSNEWGVHRLVEYATTVKEGRRVHSCFHIRGLGFGADGPTRPLAIVRAGVAALVMKEEK